MTGFSTATPQGYLTSLPAAVDQRGGRGPSV